MCVLCIKERRMEKMIKRHLNLSLVEEHVPPQPATMLLISGPLIWYFLNGAFGSFD